MENQIVAQPPVVGAVLKSLGDNQFCISSTIGKPELVPSIFTEANKSHEQEITDIVNAFSSMGVPFCPPAVEETMREEVQYVNTSLVDSKVYSNQKGITLVDRIRGGVNHDIKIKTGELMTAWPLKLFHFQVPSFTSTTDKEMVASMETAIEEVQGVYARVFSNSNEENPSKKEEPESLKGSERCLWTATAGAMFGFGVAVAGYTIYEIIHLSNPSLTPAGLVGTLLVFMGTELFFVTRKAPVNLSPSLDLVSDLGCGITGRRNAWCRDADRNERDLWRKHSPRKISDF